MHCHDANLRKKVFPFFLFVFLQTDLTVNTLLAVQWFGDFEADFGNVEGIQVQPMTPESYQAQNSASKGRMAQPLEHQSSQPQPQGIHAQPRGVATEPFAAVQQLLSANVQHSRLIDNDAQPWGFYTQPSGMPQTQSQGCQTQPLGLQAQPYAVHSNTAWHATVSKMVSEHVQQPDTPDQQEAELLNNILGIFNSPPGKIPNPAEQCTYLHQGNSLIGWVEYASCMQMRMCIL